MYRKDFIQKKKRQAIRTLSQSGRKPSAGKLDAKGGEERGVGVPGRLVRGRTRGRGQRKSLAANPFLKTTGTLAPSKIQPQSSQNNPFLAQIAKNEAPVLSSNVANQARPLPSYASVVSGNRQGQQQARFPVPSFISHGPNSVPVLVSDTQGDTHRNPFLDQHTSLSTVDSFPPPSLPPPPPYQLPFTAALSSEDLNTSLSNPFLTTLSGAASSTSTASIPPSFQGGSTADFGLHSVIKEHSSTQRPVLQAPLDTGGLLSTGMGGPVLVLDPQSDPDGLSLDVLEDPAIVSSVVPSSNKALHVKGISEELNNQVTLLKHFSQFGQVVQLKCNSYKRYATVEFASREEAALAKSRGKTISPHHAPVQIFWNAMKPTPGATAMVSTLPPVPEETSMQDPQLEGPQVRIVRQSNLVWDPRVSVAKESDEQQRAKRQEKEDSSMSMADIAQISEDLHRQPPPTASQYTQPKNPLKSVVHEAKKRGMGASKSTTLLKVQGKSILERLGKKPDKRERSLSQKLSITVRGRGAGKTVRKAKMVAAEEEEWMPEGEGEGEESDGVEDEGVFEGRNVVDSLGNLISEDAMDTIARTANHPYYLRSLHQPEAYPGPAAPTVAVSVPRRLPAQRRRSQLPAPSYDIPTPILPPPPPPKGDTAGDYYEALHARDLEIRKGMVRQTSLMEAKAIVGTCPDMCPEKERYGRASQRRLSLFELCDTDPLNPRVDHARAIKEYSGSAADKEEPLPHELRPLGVLCMTMDHLVTTVMDEGEERWAEWYDFVWNRTRAIRKDITLQHLCEPRCVELTEKCSRFHILCAHLLCEEDMNIFDPKLNNENLTKCMQSLKEFYRDLRTEQGLHCPNEAEFCCYDILLHLNDGDVLNLVQHYSDQVRHSPEVQFAVDVALAIDSNNFVKFFKLAQSTTFLNACIMHRYFNQVRGEGLRVLNQAHSVPSRPMRFPLSDLRRMLMFESEQEAAEFCELHNLSVSKKFAQFTKGGIVIPEQALPICRSLNLVESKNTKYLGEVVHGGPLPPPPTHTPYCSFTAEPHQAGEPTSTPTLEPTPQPSYSEEDVVMAFDVAEDLVLSEETQDVATECLQEAHAEYAELVNQQVTLLCAEVEGEVVGKECKEVAQRMLLEAVKQRDYEREQARLREEAAQSLTSDLLVETTTAEVEAIAQESLRQCILDAEARDSAISLICASLLEEGVCGTVKEVARETIKLVKQEKREKLEGLKSLFLTRQVGKSWKRWRHMVKVRQHVRQCASDIPPLPPLVSLPWQLETLLPLEKRRKLEWPLDPASLQDLSGETLDILSHSRAELEKKRKAFLTPLNLPVLLQDALLASRTPAVTSSSPLTPSTPDICWQLLLLCPSQQQMSCEDEKNLDWLKGKLRFEQCEDGEATSSVVSKISVSTTQIRSQASQKLQIAVKAVCGDVQEVGMSLRQELLGTSAVAVYVPMPMADQSPEAFTAHILSQMSETVIPLPDSPSIPLLALCSSEMERDHLAHWLKLRMGRPRNKANIPPDAKYLAITAALNSWVQHSIVSDIHCRTLNLPTANSTANTDEAEKQLRLMTSIMPKFQTEVRILTFHCQVCAGLQWLAEHSPSQPDLLFLPLREFIEQVLLNHFVPLVVAESEQRRKSGLPSLPPSPLAALYNAVLDHAAHEATHPTLRNLSWPVVDFAPSEFTQETLPPSFWNTPEYLDLLQGYIADLKLPDAGRLSLMEESDWSSQCVQCLQYVSRIRTKDDQKSLIPLISRIKSLLYQHSKSELVASHMTQPKGDQSYSSISWDQVILACVEHILSHVRSDLYVTCFHDSKKGFKVPGVWLHAQAETSLAQAAREMGCVTRRERHHRRHRSDPSLPTPHTLTPITVNVSLLVRGVMEGEEQLEASLRREKALSRGFEKQLQQWMSPVVNDPPRGHSLSPSTPHLPTPSLHLRTPSHDDSLESGLKLLTMKIKAARWQDTADDAYFRTVSN